MFSVKDILEERRPLYAALASFVKSFPVKKLGDMTIDEFVEGKRNTNSFCYGIEWALDGLGNPMI